MRNFSNYMTFNEFFWAGLLGFYTYMLIYHISPNEQLTGRILILFFGLFFFQGFCFIFLNKSERTIKRIKNILSHLVFMIMVYVVLYAHSLDSGLFFYDNGLLSIKGIIFFAYSFVSFFLNSRMFGVFNRVYERTTPKEIRIMKEKGRNNKEFDIKLFCSLIGISKDTYDVLLKLDEDKTELFVSKLLEQESTPYLDEMYSIRLINIADGFSRLHINSHNYTESVERLNVDYGRVIDCCVEIINEESNKDKLFFDKKNEEILEDVLTQDNLYEK